MIGQELFTFAIVKPTTTSKEEKDLEISDLPEVVVCLEPGFDTEVLKNYGYKTLGYYRGSMDGDKFAGWNGNENHRKSSLEILEEALIVKNSTI